MVTRAVVVMSNVLLCGPLLRFGIGFTLENAHCAWEGSPVPQASEIDSGNGPVGVTVIV